MIIIIIIIIIVIIFIKFKFTFITIITFNNFGIYFESQETHCTGRTIMTSVLISFRLLYRLEWIWRLLLQGYR